MQRKKSTQNGSEVVSEQPTNGNVNGLTNEETSPTITPDKNTIRCAYIVTGVNQGCMFMYLGFMPFLYKQYGMDPVTFGFVQSAFCFLQLCSSPIIGKVADVAGSRSMILLSMISLALAHLIMGLATSVPMLILSRACSLFMDVMPATQMLMTDLVPEKDRSTALRKTILPLSVGMIVAPALGGTIAKYIGNQGTLMLTWMLPLLCIIAILTFIPARTKQSSASAAGKKAGTNWGKVSELLFKGDIPFLFIMRLLSTFPGMLFMMNWQMAGVTYFKMTPQGNGMVVSCLGIMNMINNGFVLGWIGKKFSDNTLLKWATVISACTFAAMSQTTAVWQLVVLLWPTNLSYSIMENQIMTRLTKSVPATDTSTMVGVGTALFQLSRTLSPAGGGFLMRELGWPGIGQAGAVVSILMVTMCFLKIR